MISRTHTTVLLYVRIQGYSRTTHLLNTQNIEVRIIYFLNLHTLSITRPCEAEARPGCSFSCSLLPFQAATGSATASCLFKMPQALLQHYSTAYSPELLPMQGREGKQEYSGPWKPGLQCRLSKARGLLGKPKGGREFGMGWG